MKKMTDKEVEKIEFILMDHDWIFVPFGDEGLFRLAVYIIHAEDMRAIPSSVCSSESYVMMADYCVELNDRYGIDKKQFLEIVMNEINKSNQEKMH